MKASVCHEWGPPGVLRVEDCPQPPLPPDHARVAVRSAGIAFQDTLMIAGKYQTRPAFPVCPGNEICAEVEECGAGVSGLRQGDSARRHLVHGTCRDQETILAALSLFPAWPTFDAGREPAPLARGRKSEQRRRATGVGA
jgi:NADPH2:quinone reductase